MVSAWGNFWGSAWGGSWGWEIVVPPVVVPPVLDVVRETYSGPPGRVTANKLTPGLHGSVYRSTWRDG